MWRWIFLTIAAALTIGCVHVSTEELTGEIDERGAHLRQECQVTTNNPNKAAVETVTLEVAKEGRCIAWSHSPKTGEPQHVEFCIDRTGSVLARTDHHLPAAAPFLAMLKDEAAPFVRVRDAMEYVARFNPSVAAQAREVDAMFGNVTAITFAYDLSFDAHANDFTSSVSLSMPISWEPLAGRPDLPIAIAFDSQQPETKTTVDWWTLQIAPKTIQWESEHAGINRWRRVECTKPQPIDATASLLAALRADLPHTSSATADDFKGQMQKMATGMGQALFSALFIGEPSAILDRFVPVGCQESLRRLEKTLDKGLCRSIDSQQAIGMLFTSTDYRDSLQRLQKTFARFHWAPEDTETKYSQAIQRVCGVAIENMIADSKEHADAGQKDPTDHRPSTWSRLRFVR